MGGFVVYWGRTKYEIDNIIGGRCCVLSHELAVITSTLTPPGPIFLKNFH